MGPFYDAVEYEENNDFYEDDESYKGVPEAEDSVRGVFETNNEA